MEKTLNSFHKKVWVGCFCFLTMQKWHIAVPKYCGWFQHIAMPASNYAGNFPLKCCNAMQHETFGPNMLQIFCKRLQGMFSKCCEYHARWHGFAPQKGSCHQPSNQLLSAFIYVGLMLGHLELIMLPTLGQIWRGIIFSKEHTCPYKNDPPKSVSLLCEVCISENKPCWGHVGPRITR